jgi:hypothetical protein
MAWTFFRASSINSASRMLEGMFLFNGISLPSFFSNYQNIFDAIHLKTSLTGIFMGIASFNMKTLFFVFLFTAVIVWGAPNTQRILQTERVHSMTTNKLVLSVVVLGFMFAASMINFSHVQTFIYFQF